MQVFAKQIPALIEVDHTRHRQVLQEQLGTNASAGSKKGRGIANPEGEDVWGATDGCIGLVGGPEEAHRYYDKMQKYFKSGNKTMRIKVKINNNANRKY